MSETVVPEVEFPIDLDTLKLLAYKAVELRGPEFIYDNASCFYWNELKGCADCLIGTILWLAGVPAEELQKGDADKFLGIHNNYLTKYFTEDAVHYASEMQQKQDDLVPWGAAVRGTFEIKE